jgi:rhodanese-related sulfurtransferase
MTTPTPAPANPPQPHDARGVPAGYNFKPEWEVSPCDTKARMDAREPNLLVLDCRRPDEHQLARIPGATLIPMNEIDRRTDELEDDDLGKSRPIIVHCHHGARSLRVTATLRGLGFTNVFSMAGGIESWSVAIDPRVPRY